MRFNRRITFITQAEDFYNPHTGEYVVSEPIKVTKACNLSALGINRRKELFGDIQEEVLVARLQQPYTHTFAYVEVGKKRYKVTQQSNYRKGVLFLGRDNLAD